MIIRIFTGFPGFFDGPLEQSMIHKAMANTDLRIEVVNLRDFATDNYKSIDDYPFGGGSGMVVKCEPVFTALAKHYKDRPDGQKHRIIYPNPQGRLLTQDVVEELLQADELNFISGRYKGIDQRIIDHWVTDEISLGDFVLSTGDIPILAVVDALARLLPGALNTMHSAATDSFNDGLLDCAYYTRPAEYRGLKVPEVLLSGDHKKIEEFRQNEKERRTRTKRPDLFAKYIEKKK
jgi:tRNA (guanine37-N1)-methyltransferase